MTGQWRVDRIDGEPEWFGDDGDRAMTRARELELANVKGVVAWYQSAFVGPWVEGAEVA